MNLDRKFCVWLWTLLVFALSCCSGPPMPEAVQEHSAPVRTPEAILNDLRSPLAGDRRNAILECLEHSLQECVPELRKLIRDPDPGIRAVAAIGLGQFRDVPSLRLIVALKKDPEIPSENILDALNRMAIPEVGAHVVEYLESSNHTLRLLAVEVLANSKATSQGPTVLKMAIQNPDSEKAKTYAMVLGHLRYRPAEDYLIRLLRSEEDGPTKAAAILALGRMGSKKATSTLIDILSSDFLKGRENAHQALREIRDPATFSRLFPLLEHKDREVRFFAANLMALFDTEQNRLQLREFFQDAIRKKKSTPLAPVAIVLGEWKDEPSRSAIESLLLQKESPDREDLARALGWMGNPESESVLLQVLEESSGEGRYGAAWALGFVGGEKAVEALLKKAKSSDQRLAILSLEALGNLKTEKSIPTLVRLSSDENLAPFAISSLSVIPGEKARLELETMAKSSRMIQKRLAIQALGQRKEPASKPLLEELTRSPDAEVRKLARFALKGYES